MTAVRNPPDRTRWVAPYEAVGVFVALLWVIVAMVNLIDGNHVQSMLAGIAAMLGLVLAALGRLDRHG